MAWSRSLIGKACTDRNPAASARRELRPAVRGMRKVGIDHRLAGDDTVDARTLG